MYLSLFGHGEVMAWCEVLVVFRISFSEGTHLIEGSLGQ